MEKQEKISILEKTLQNNDESIELAYQVLKISEDRNDVESANQVKNDIAFLKGLKERFQNEKRKLME